MNIVHISITDDEWEALDDGRYISTIAINGCHMHLTAYPVLWLEGNTFSLDGFYEVEIILMDLCDGPPTTTLINNKEFALLAEPFQA